MSVKTSIAMIAVAGACASALTAPPALAADGKGLYQTLYYISCESYAADRKEPENTGKNAVDKIYVSGWLSGYNYLTPNTFDIIPNHNVDMVMQWLDQYCAKKPTSSIEAGLLQLTDELYPDRVQAYPTPATAAPATPADNETKFQLPPDKPK